MHALIIEDSYFVAMSIEDALRPLGYISFDIVVDVAAACAAAEARCPDLIIADQRLASGTGTDAVKRICADKILPVVFVTGSANEVRAELPSAIVINKPFHTPGLHGAISRAIVEPYSSGGASA